MTPFVCNAGSLKTLPLFSSLRESELEALAPALRTRTCAPRQYIVRAGDRADGIHLIVSGRVNVLLDDGQGRQIILAVLGPNDSFGEAALYNSGVHLTTIESLEACELLYVPKSTVVRLVEHNSSVATLMLQNLAGRLTDAQRKIGNLGLLDVYGRVASVLMEVGREVNGEWLVDTGSERIAAMVGASREMVSRVVKSMILAGAVRRYKRKLIVLNRTSLLARVTRQDSTRRPHEKTPLIGWVAQRSAA